MDVGADVTLDGVPCLGGDLDVPLPGTWTCETTAAGDDSAFSVGQKVTLSVRGTTRVGTVVSAGAPDMRWGLRIVGGSGTLGTVVPDRDYVGKSLQAVVADVLASAGQPAGDLSALSSVSLAHWVRAREPASDALHRLARLFPQNVVLRALPNGTMGAVALTWPTIIAQDLESERVNSFVAENVAPEPGTTVVVLGASLRVDRALYVWDGPDLHVTTWFRGASDAGDRFRAALGKLAREAEKEYRGPDYRAMYAARVTSPGSRRIAVAFEDDLGRFRSLSDVEVLASVGDTDVWAKGSRVLVGWKFADERFPYAVPAWSPGSGGLVSRTTTLQTTLTLAGGTSGSPLLDVQQDARAQHLLGGGGVPTVVGQGTTTATLQSGSTDTFAKVQIVLTEDVASGQELFELSYSRAYPSAGYAVAGMDLGFPLGASATTSKATVLAGQTGGVPAGTYVVTVISGGT